MSTFRRLPAPVRRGLVRTVKPRFTVGAVLVATRSPGEVLLVRQRHTGGWGLPGGLLDRGESAAQALARELQEELDLRIEVDSLDPPLVNVDAGARRVDVVFRCDGDLPSVPRPRGPEVLEATWFAPGSLPTLTAPAAQVLRLHDLVP